MQTKKLTGNIVAVKHICLMDNTINKFENYHIVLWLIKDLCWALVWRPLGMAMIIPTVGLAVYIAYISYTNRVNFLHNVAIVLWISANAIWMTGEFYENDTRPIAVILFLVGLAIIAGSYIFKQKPKTI